MLCSQNAQFKMLHLKKQIFVIRFLKNQLQTEQ